MPVALVSDMGFNGCMNISSIKSSGSTLARSRLAVRIIFGISFALFLVTIFAWWYFVYNNSERTFWRMVDKSLSAASFTRTIVQDSAYQQVNQSIAARTSPDQLAYSTTEINQEGDDIVNVKTESLGTPWEDFIRYTSIDTSSEGVTDFDKVVNVWGKAESTGPETNGQIYNQAVLNVIPFGSLSKQDRVELVTFMQDKEVYKFRLVETRRSNIFARPILAYQVQVNPRAYVETLQLYARMVGLTQLESIDASMYGSSGDFEIGLTVDGWANNLEEVSYEDGARVERVAAYGARYDFPDVPTDAIPYEELQNRLWGTE